MDADVGRLHCELARGRTQVFLTSGSWQVARSSEQSLSCCIGEIGQVARTTNPQLNLGPHASIFEGLQTEGGIRIRRAPTDDFGSRSAADYPWTEEDRVKHDSQNACWVHALLSYNVLHLDRVAPCTSWTDGRHCSQDAGANVDFGDEGAVDWAFLGNLKQLRALLLG